MFQKMMFVVAVMVFPRVWSQQNFALQFDGVDDFVEVPHSPSLVFDREITIASWACVEGGSSGWNIVNKWEGSTQNILLAVGDKLSFYIWPYPADPLDSNQQVPHDQWVHLAAVWDSQAAKIYLDGALDREISVDNAIANSNAPMRIGAIFRDDILVPPIKGKLDELVIFSRALSAQEIEDTMNHSLTGAESGLVAYYNFDEGSGQILTDRSVHGNHGRLGSTASADGTDPTWILREPDSPPLPPRVPSPLSVEYRPLEFNSAIIRWGDSSPDVTRFVVDYREGLCDWVVLDDNVLPTVRMLRHQYLPDGEHVCYRVSAVNQVGSSVPTETVCINTRSLDRWQLKIYVPGSTPNELGSWEDFRPCDSRFLAGRGTAVIVHGYNPDRIASLNQVTWALEVAKAISETQRFEEAERPNILAWEWLEEAEGGEGLSVARYDRAYYAVENQARIFSGACRKTLPSQYRQSVHLMGYSFGAYLVASAGVGLTTASDPETQQFLIKHVTLWDPPTRAYANAKIEADIRRLRQSDLGVYVDVLVGVAETGTLFANEWVDVPGTVPLPEGHNVYNWYKKTIPVGTDPQLLTRQGDPYPGEPPPTIGFGTSALLGQNARRPDDGCHDPNLGTLMFNHRLRTPDRVFHLRGYQCAFRDSPIQQGTANTDGGVFGGDCGPFVCINQSPTRIALGTASGVGAGAGGRQDGGLLLVATFSLELTVDPAWDELSFQYDFLAAPAEAVLSFSLTVDGETHPLWQMSSDPTLDDGFLDSGLFTITQLQGKEVILHFSLSSAQSGAQVAIQDLTFWQSPTHGNRSPIANAGPDQTVAGDPDGFAAITLDGSATTDPDGDALLYWWELDGEFFTNGVQPAEQICIGQHLIKLIVRDPVDNISTDEVVITVTGDPTFIRADSNNDGAVDISDAVNTLSYLFSGTGNVTCQDAADANDSGFLDISDAIFTLGFLFLGTPAVIPAPHPNLGPDQTVDSFGCERC